ncbi:MAG TPA: PBP1A family penicillin-binding protein [Thermoanaerobaculia bacterium]|nr:PBP1A family penicillin-binding protein [Thermoanaerobaculia bacterium]
MSRGATLLRWTLPLFLALFIVIESFCIYVFVLDRRVARELAGRSWRTPTTILSAAHGAPRELVRVYGADWRPSPPVLIEELPPHVADAFIATEDVRFRHHPGVDPIGILRALFRNVRAGGIRQGGSTIPQQVIKQHFLTNERTWRRKFVEMVLSVALDARFSKDEILELYLNDVYLGHHNGAAILGVDEAARIYFDKSAKALRVDEAALLAAMVHAPNRDNPEKRPDIVRARRDMVLHIMRKEKMIDDAQLNDAIARDVDVNRGTLLEQPFPYYLHALRAEVVREVGEARVHAGGMSIVCEMDGDAQRAAERAASRGAARLASRYSWIAGQSRSDPLQVAILSVDPRSGGIRALVGGTDFHRSPFDRTSQMRRQPGSAFKTFAYLAAIAAKRATPASLLLDAPVKVRLGNDETWEPQNYDEQFRGRVTLRESFERSLNVPTVRLANDVGISRVKKTAENFGFANVNAVPALPLGVGEVSLRELTAAYTPFPNLGDRVEPFLLTRITAPNGKVLFEHTPKRKRVVDAAPAYVMHTLLRGVVRRGTASRLARYGLGYVAGKTGTTNDYRDAWFVGYTADVVTTVWVGFDRGAPLRLSSSEAALPIWGAYMSATEHEPARPKPPKGVTFRDIDPESGMLWRDGCPGPINEVFLSGTAPTHACPRGIFGRALRRILFNEDHFDEPPAITFEKFRRWANDVDRNRQHVESALDKLRRIFD